ncbi:HGxxPAAW family protein [Bogoriella caseilytica]|uniref:Uncharacterized protein n=1 Tax=Bogoriella caseilytica TaxID=56055 RepID=A0A3N2B8V4_9MICO|nr:HGxxPAAW family protein [Bogoriella caseilytica]ROR71671.1 hypothetical protein EDD31_0008 [Bogoriella caseilytica]
MPQLPQPQSYTLPPASPAHNHGRTVAAWVLVWAVTLGFLLSGVGLALIGVVEPGIAWGLLIAGAAVIVLGLVLSVGMRMAGYGQPKVADMEKRDWYDG